MLNKAVLLLLFALTGSPSGEAPVDVAPSALAVAAVPLRADLTLGAWQGTLIDGAGVRRPVEVSVADGVRRETVFGYFTLLSKGREVTVRRLGRVVGDDLVFELRDGGRVAMHLLSGRLVGDVVDPAGQLVPGGGTLELGRLRP
ncbi:MAG TPA: hypothetical protein VGM22_25045 [Methylomirabilota bacterium]|jgi:hypothetical protein